MIAWECSRTWDIGDPFRECLWFLVVGPKGVDGRCRLSGVFGSWRIDGLVATRRRRGAGYALPVGDFGVGRYRPGDVGGLGLSSDALAARRCSQPDGSL